MQSIALNLVLSKNEGEVGGFKLNKFTHNRLQRRGNQPDQDRGAETAPANKNMVREKL